MARSARSWPMRPVIGSSSLVDWKPRLAGSTVRRSSSAGKGLRASAAMVGAFVSAWPSASVGTDLLLCGARLKNIMSSPSGSLGPERYARVGLTKRSRKVRHGSAPREKVAEMSPTDGQRMAAALGRDRAPLHDGRQSPAALHIARGVGRVLASLGLASVSELPLPNGRRADIVALSEKGDIWIVKIKSSIEDFRADQKWPAYSDYCHRLCFAVSPVFPQELLPPETGIIVADRYGG